MTAHLRLLAALLSLLSIAAPADAATCSVSATGVGFGSYDPLDAGEVQTTGGIDLDCDAAVSAVVSLTAGSGSYAGRRLLNGSAALTYNLYIDSAGTRIWGDGTQGSASVTLSGSAHATVYGRLPGGQNPVAGRYSDTIVVEVAY